MTDKIIVFCSCETAAEAAAIARLLVEKRLAACVGVAGGVKSVYRWKGRVEEAEEALLTIKTRRGLFAAVEAEIRKAHSYETPEIVAIPIVDGSEEYLSWVDTETKSLQEG